MATTNSFGSNFLNPITGATNPLGYMQNNPNPYNATGQPFGPVKPNTVGSNTSATAPTTPQNIYTQQVANSLQSANLPNPNQNNTGQSMQLMNGQGVSASGQPIQTTPQTQPTGFNGTSGTNGSGVYDPYNSPEYQQYVQNAANAYQPNAQILGYQQSIANINASEALGENKLENSVDPIPQTALLGQEALLQKQALAKGNYAQAGLANALTQQGYQIAGAQVPLTAANTQAGYLAGLATPQAVSSGSALTQLNPSTGQLNTLGGLPSFGLGTGIAGQPITYNQQTGQIGGSLGSNPPSLNGSGLTSQQSSAIQSVGQTYGLTDPASQLALQTAVAQTQASNGSMSAAGVPASLQPAVAAVLSQLNPNYSPNIATGQAAATQSNTQVAGTAAVNAAAAAYPQYYQDYLNTQGAAQSVDQFGSLLTSGMVAKDGTTINPSSSQYANTLLSNFRSQLSSSQQGQFDTTYAALKSKLSGLLSVGGNETPTQLTSDVNNILSGDVPLGTLQSVLSRIQSEGVIVQNIAAQKGNEALQQAQGGGTSGVGDNGSSLYNF